MRMCSVEGCKRKHYGKGYCEAHLARIRRHGSLEDKRAAKADPRTLFEPKVDRDTTPDGCHTWTASVSSSGYGTFKLNGKVKSAHVAALILEGVNISSSEDGDHRCKNPLCVRVHPDHVQALDMAENRGEFNRTKTQCPKGHAYDESNTYWYKGRYKRCRECHRAEVLAAYYRKRSQLPDIEHAGSDSLLTLSDRHER